MKLFWADKWDKILLIFIILLGLWLRFSGFVANPSMWHDECALGWNVYHKSYAEFFGNLRFMQMAPPFFLILSKLSTKLFGFSDMTLRFVPFIASCLSILLFYFLAKRVFVSKISVVFAVFLFAVNQRLINYAFEFKPYALDVLVALFVVLAFVNFDIKKISTKTAAVWGVVSATLPFLSFPSVFVLAGVYISRVFKNFSQDFLKKVFLIIPLIFSAVFYLKYQAKAPDTMASMQEYWGAAFVTKKPEHLLILFQSAFNFYFFPSKNPLLGLFLFGWGGFLLWRGKSQFFKITITVLILVLIASGLHYYPFSNRLILFLLPFFILYIVKPLDLVGKKSILISLLSFFVVFSYLLPQFRQLPLLLGNKQFTKGEYAREMMDFMSSVILPSEKVVIARDSNIEYEYYSLFVPIKMDAVFAIEAENKKLSQEEFLNGLKRGYYWFYVPYSSPSKNDYATILNWIQQQKIVYLKGDKSGFLARVYVSP